MLLSDVDLCAVISSGDLSLEPYDAALIQPSSIDVRLDGLFRVFNSTRYTHIAVSYTHLTLPTSDLV